MRVIEVRTDHNPRVINISARTIENRMNNQVHEEVLPIEGTMSLSALKTDGLNPNSLLANLTGDDGYYGTVYFCGVWYSDLTQEQINDLLDWLEGETKK